MNVTGTHTELAEILKTLGVEHAFRERISGHAHRMRGDKGVVKRIIPSLELKR